MEVKGNLWLQGEEGLMLGKGRATLLRQIEETGSIAEAARQMEMSYRRAWGMVKAMNEAAANPLVEKSTGGKKGGGARLTAEGKKLLGSFE
ncbi:winged helix-turn-helix domain-containing protein, partial [Nafulsella turpanensis]|uniref:winged helix-turn-helix domain-containing protein n=1 Tax=Nafulsella turpanensis TaxID=1265690 RepID=UPI000346F493